MSGREGNFKSSQGRMCCDTQGIHPSIRACVRKNKREGRKRLRDLEKKKERKTSRVLSRRT